MTTTESTPAPGTRVFAHVDANLPDFALLAAPAGFTMQGRTTHFTTFYSNGLLNHEPGNIVLLKSDTSWRTSWSIIAPGNFSGRSFGDLLFYDPASGVGEFYTTEGGNIHLLQSHSGWRTSWSTIVPCNLTGGHSTDLLFYDPGAGTGEMYRTDAHGGISQLASHTDWRTSWSIIKPCKISDGQFTDLLFYDPSAGVGEFYATDGHGGISLLHTADNWRHSWSIISPANFINGAGDDVLFYDPSAGTGEIYTSRGNTLATAVLSTCEDDYEALRDYFGGVTPDDLPFRILVQSGNGGASHHGCDDTELHCDAFSGNDPDLVRMLVVAEADEVFMDNQDKGWDCGASNGEGLSRVLATHRYPNELGGFESGPSWLKSTREDFVAHNDGTDTNFVSTGCATLFIHYLKFQLGYSFEQITQAGGSTLAHTYENLTGRNDAFTPFKALLDRRFAAGTFAPLTTDNPFPIKRDLLFYDPSAGTGEFYSSDIQGEISLVGSDTGWRGSWSMILPGNFSGRSFNDLLFYDPSAGTGEFYTSDGNGQIHLLKSETGWRSSWNLIMPGRFGDNKFDGLLFYDASEGLVEIYSTDAGGNISLVNSTGSLPKNWTLGLTCNVTCGQFVDVMFYSPSAGVLQFFTTDGQGRLLPLSAQTGIGNSWSAIQATGFTEFLFYDASAGVGEYQRTDLTGKMTLLKSHTDWRRSWSLISPGVYS